MCECAPTVTITIMWQVAVHGMRQTMVATADVVTFAAVRDVDGSFSLVLSLARSNGP